MHGIHLIADLHDCRCPPGFLLDGPGLEAFCVDACTRHNLTVVGHLFHPFRDAAGQPAGVTGTVVLAESHLALHTWPEIAAVTLDVYVCNFSGDNSGSAHALFHEVIAAFAPARTERIEVKRGQLGIREQIVAPLPPDIPQQRAATRRPAILQTMQHGAAAFLPGADRQPRRRRWQPRKS